MMLSPSSCPFKKSYKPPITSLDSLPNELLVEISSCVAASSLRETYNLQLVSKSFRNFCNDEHVFRQISLHEIPLFPWRDHNREKFSRFFKRCVTYENPEGLYRKGLIDYFHLDVDKQEHGGIKYLAKAAKRGNQEAKYVYGMILISRDKTKHKGFKILSPLIKPLMSNTMKEMETLRKKIRDKIISIWLGKLKVRQLKRRYVRENCNCDGRTKTFLNKNSAWNGYGEDNDMITSSACEICFWDCEFKLFFDDVLE